MKKKRILKLQNHYGVCSFYVDDCLHVLITFYRDQKVYLLHKSNEDEKVHLTYGKKVQIDDITKYRIRASIVLYVP